MNRHERGQAHVESVGILWDSTIVLNSGKLKAGVDHIGGRAGDGVEDIGCVLESEVAYGDTRGLLDVHQGRASVVRVRGEFCARYIHQDVKIWIIDGEERAEGRSDSGM